MHTTIFALLAMGAGACIAIQASANGDFRKSLGDNPLFAAFFSICGTFLTAITAMLLFRPAIPSAARNAVVELDWWAAGRADRAGWCGAHREAGGGALHRAGRRRAVALLAGARSLRACGPERATGHPWPTVGRGARGGRCALHQVFVT
jgi:hypothetical protein